VEKAEIEIEIAKPRNAKYDVGASMGVIENANRVYIDG
jgi:hypothetical protein